MLASNLPEPPALVSNVDPLYMLLFFGSLAAGASATAILWSIRRRDVLPVAACIGAMAAALNEPIFDILGKLVYADNSRMAFTAFSRQIPWFLVIGYVPWVGLLPYVVSRMMAKGVPRRTLHFIALASVASAGITELVNLRLHAWEYYGEAPLKYFGGLAAVAGLPLVAGFLMYAVADKLTGWQRALAGMVIPTMSLPLVFAATGWPLYLALYSDLPPVLDFAAAGLACALVAATVFSTTAIAEGWRSGQIALNPGPHPLAGDLVRTRASRPRR